MDDAALRAALRDAQARPDDGAAQARAVAAAARAGVDVPRDLALRAADASPDDDALQVSAAAACRREGWPPPVRVLARRPRWRAFAAFVARWFVRPLQDHSGTPSVLLDAVERKLGALPLALREWYELCGRRPDVLGNVQDRATEPDELRPDEEGLVAVYVQSQGALAWGVRREDLDRDDPAAFMSENPGRVALACDSLAAFLHRMVVHQSFARRGAVVARHGGADAAALATIARAWPQLAFAPLRWEVGPDVPEAERGYELGAYVLHGDDDVLIEVDTLGHVSLQARDAETLGRARALLPTVEWPRT